MKRARRTPQCDAVLGVVRAAHDHPTAEQVFSRVRDLLPQVSLGTIYRNLDKLAADGLLQVVQLGERQARYDAVTAPHDHFLCVGCGVVADLHLARVSGAALRAFEDRGYRVEEVASTAFGRCPACAVARAPGDSLTPS